MLIGIRTRPLILPRRRSVRGGGRSRTWSKVAPDHLPDDPRRICLLGLPRCRAMPISPAHGFVWVVGLIPIPLRYPPLLILTCPSSSGYVLLVLDSNADANQCDTERCQADLSFLTETQNRLIYGLLRTSWYLLRFAGKTQGTKGGTERATGFRTATHYCNASSLSPESRPFAGGESHAPSSTFLSTA